MGAALVVAELLAAAAATAAKPPPPPELLVLLLLGLLLLFAAANWAMLFRAAKSARDGSRDPINELRLNNELSRLELPSKFPNDTVLRLSGRNALEPPAPPPPPADDRCCWNIWLTALFNC